MIRHAPPGPGLLSNRDQIVLQELLRAADIPEPPRILQNRFNGPDSFLQKFAIFQRFSSNFAPILIKISRNFAEYSKE